MVTSATSISMNGIDFPSMTFTIAGRKVADLDAVSDSRVRSALAHQRSRPPADGSPQTSRLPKA